MKKFLAISASALALCFGAPIAVEPAAAQQINVASACSAQVLVPGFGNGWLTITTNGDLCTNATGGGGGSASYTAAAAPFAVAAGVNKPAGIDTANSAQFTELCVPGTTTCIDPSGPSGVRGADQTNIMSRTNPLSVGGAQITASQAPTTLASAYSTGQALAATTNYTGFFLVNGGSGLLQSVGIDFKSNLSSTNAAVDLFVFSQSPSSTCTAGSAFVLSASDFGFVKVVHLTDTTAGNTTTHLQATNLALPINNTSSGTGVWVCAVTRGAPTLGTTSDMTITLNAILN